MQFNRCSPKCYCVTARFRITRPNGEVCQTGASLPINGCCRCNQAQPPELRGIPGQRPCQSLFGSEFDCEGVSPFPVTVTIEELEQFTTGRPGNPRCSDEFCQSLIGTYLLPTPGIYRFNETPMVSNNPNHGGTCYLEIGQALGTTQCTSLIDIRVVSSNQGIVGECSAMPTLNMEGCNDTNVNSTHRQACPGEVYTDSIVSGSIFPTNRCCPSYPFKARVRFSR